MKTTTCILFSLLLASASYLPAAVWTVDFDAGYSTGTNVNLPSTNSADWDFTNTNGVRTTNILDQTDDAILSGQYLDFSQGSAGGGPLQLYSTDVAYDAGNTLFEVEFDLHDRVGDTNVTTVGIGLWVAGGGSSQDRLLLTFDDGVVSGLNAGSTVNYNEGEDVTFRLLVNGGEAADGGLSANSYSLFINGGATAITNVALGGTAIEAFQDVRISGDNTATGLDSMSFDNLSATIIPEPSSFALVGLSFLAGFLGFRRRLR